MQPAPRPRTAQPSLPRLAVGGGLPLALELAAAYAEMQRLGVESVLQEGNMMGLTAAFRADPKRVLLKRLERTWRMLRPRQQRFSACLALLPEPPALVRECWRWDKPWWRSALLTHQARC